MGVVQALLVGLLAVGLRAEVLLNLKENMKLPSSYENNEFSTNATDLDYAWDRASPPLGPPFPLLKVANAKARAASEGRAAKAPLLASRQGAGRGLGR